MSTGIPITPIPYVDVDSRRLLARRAAWGQPAGTRDWLDRCRMAEGQSPEAAREHRTFGPLGEERNGR